MTAQKEAYYKKRGEQLVKNLQKRHFDACFCKDRSEALAHALSLIPEGSSVGWGGTVSAQELGLFEALRNGKYSLIDRDICKTPEERNEAMKKSLLADVFITGANAVSLDGQLVNIDGTGNRVAALAFGPESVLVIVGMNKVADTLEDAITRARTVAAPMNQQRFLLNAPCSKTGSCADCISDGCICNQVLITRNCRPAGRIKVMIVGEDLGF